MSYVDELKSQMVADLDRIESVVEWMDRNGPAIIRIAAKAFFDNSIVPVPSFLWEPAVNEVIGKLHELAGFIEKFLKVNRALVAFVGSPDRLRAAADVLNTKIANAVTDLAPLIVLGKLDSTMSANWSDGAASEGYFRAIDGRSAAVTEAGTVATGLAGALGQTADAIENFYISLAMTIGGIVAAVVSLAAAIASLETVVGPILSLIAAIISIIVACVGAFQMIETMTQQANNIGGALSPHVPSWPAVLH